MPRVQVRLCPRGWTWARWRAARGRQIGRSMLAGVAALVALASVEAAAAPPIRMSNASRVPACVTPERLMAFLVARNQALAPKFRSIAHHYRRHGEAWRVRWDYAFFQMVIETNYLQFRRGNGQPGDVRPWQNNFAGLGTTGGGVRGDAYPDVSTGVLAQIQHLVVYSGERIDNPVGPRTRKTQKDIISFMHRVTRRRPATFQDLSGRWAADRRYGRLIELIAQRFRGQFCGVKVTWAAKIVAPKPTPVIRPSRTRRPMMPAFSGLGAAGVRPPAPVPAPRPMVRPRVFSMPLLSE